MQINGHNATKSRFALEEKTEREKCRLRNEAREGLKEKELYGRGQEREDKMGMG